MCPLAGVYAFHATVHAVGGTRCRLDLYKNEQAIGRMWSDCSNAPHGQGGNMFVLELQDADTVSLRSTYPEVCTVQGEEMYNTFSGFKIE